MHSNIHNISHNPFPEYIPFTNHNKGSMSKSCFVKGWKNIDCNKARNTINECPADCWIQRRLRVRDDNGNYYYNGLIVVDIDDPSWAEYAFDLVKKEKLHCIVRETKRGYHIIFRFVPNIYNASASDLMYAMSPDDPSPREGSHYRTALVTDNVVDYKFTEIVRHIEDCKGEYIGFKSGNDVVIDRKVVYELYYSEEETNKRNIKEQLPSWYPGLDDIPDWLIPIRQGNAVIFPVKMPYKQEIEDMIESKDNYYNNGINIKDFLIKFNDTFKYKIVMDMTDMDSSRKIYLYSKGVYKYVSDDTLAGIIDKIIFESGCHTASYVRYVSSIITALKRQIDMSYYCDYNDLDACVDYVNFENGMLNLITGHLESHSPRFLSSIQIPCEWDVDDREEPKIFLSYLERLTQGLDDQKDIIELILQYLGLCISNYPVYKTKAALFFCGESNTGKSQIFNMMHNLLGSRNSVPMDLKELSENRFAKIQLFKKRLLVNGDLNHGTMITSASIFKNITSGDVIFAEEKFKGLFSFTYSGGAIFCCNKLPIFAEQDEGLYNRVYVVPCNNVIPWEERDPDLQEKFRSEYPRIIKLMLREMLKLKKNNWSLYQGSTIAKSRIAYKNLSDNVAEFVDYAVVKSNANEKSSLFWYDAYADYAKKHSQKVLMKKLFIERLLNITGECKQHKRTGNVISNISPSQEILNLMQISN